MPPIPLSPVIGITLGDPAGIGPEVVAAALRSGQLDSRFTYRVIGSPGETQPGRPTPESSRTAQAALEEAVQLGLAGQVAAVVTGPLSKARMHEVGFEFP